MSSESNEFMPSITCARGGYSSQVDSRGQSHTLLRPSVITMGTPLRVNKDYSNTFSAVVEGIRTGQRRAVPNDLSVRGLENKIDSLRREIAALSEESQVAKEKIRQKSKDEQKIKRKLSMMSIKLEEESARRIITVEELFRAIQRTYQFMWNENLHLRKLLDKAEVKCNGIFSELDNERNFKQHAEEKEQQQMLDLEEENKRLQEKLEKLEKHNFLLESGCDAMPVLEKELMQTQEQLQRAIKELTDAQNTIASSELTMNQVRLFVQLICQPNFTVVKDTSLTPVAKDRADPSGFVLVPLPVMLHGYSLLSPSDRRNIVELYQVHLQ